MATPTIDKWLKGLEDLTELDPDELESRLSALRADIQMMQLKIGVLEQLHAEAKRRAPRDELKTTGGGRDPQRPSNAGPDDRAGTWKRDAVLDFLRRHPDDMFRPVEIRDALRKEGVLEGDDGTPTPLLLRRMARVNQVAQTSGGRYGYKDPEVSPHQSSFATRDVEP